MNTTVHHLGGRVDVHKAQAIDRATDAAYNLTRAMRELKAIDGRYADLCAKVEEIHNQVANGFGGGQ